MEVIPIPALDDNYMYLLVDNKTKQCAAVDPVESDKLMDVVKQRNLTLGSILTTHHHWDHAGGNKKLMSEYPQISCYGYDHDKIEGLNCTVKHEQTWNMGSLTIKVLHTPCHTTDHVCYYVTEGKRSSVLFSGDTLFIAGCGKFFQGTAEQMHHALCKVISGLPGYTKIYCGHEYTVSNLTFAHHVEPDNSNITEKLSWAMDRRCRKQYTVPSTLEEELTYNPFMRVRFGLVKWYNA